MTREVALLVVSLATFADAQQTTRLVSVLVANDSTSVITEVRRRPGDARNLLGDLVAQAGRSRPFEADSILRLSYRLASAYTEVWEDSFPLTNLARFNRLSQNQRRAKVVADSIRVAGNTAFGARGVSAAISLSFSRDSAVRSSSLCWRAR